MVHTALVAFAFGCLVLQVHTVAKPMGRFAATGPSFVLVAVLGWPIVFVDPNSNQC